MTVKRVILIRNGETDWNIQGRWQGWVSVPLNEHGKQQVQALANFVRNIGMSALYASDLKRARQTAEILAERLGFEPIFDERLRERNIGQWQGLTVEEMRDWYPEEYEGIRNDPMNYPVPGGESRQQAQQRLLGAFNDILTQVKGETVGIVSHTTALKALMVALIPDYQDRDLGNTAVTTLVRQDDDQWQLVAEDDLLHLEGLSTRSVPEVEDDR